MTTSEKIKRLGLQTKVPVEWCRIFADAVQRVENRLGVPLDAERGGKNHCIFIFPKSLSYSKESIRNLNFAGFDYWGAWEQPGHAFDMSVVVGVKNDWYNNRLFKKLKENPTLIDIIEDFIKKFCPKFRLSRSIRFNKIAMTFYAWIKDYTSLKDYIKDVNASGIYFPRMTPAQCITKLNSLGVTSGEAIDKLKKFRYKEYNWLEYLCIVADSPIKCKDFLEGDTAEFERQLLLLLILIILIDLIFRENPDTVKIIEELIEKILPFI